MAPPFEITEEDVALLNDVLLRDLMRKLIEAEAMANGISVGCVSVGGDIKAPDGGDDGSVEWSAPPISTTFFPRNNTIFQCKAESMPACDIVKEMAPKGKVRDLFNKLIKSNGAYVIFSNAKCSSSMLKSRKDAMVEALKGKTGSKNLALDFYSADKVAMWTNQHHGVAIWLREQLGKAVIGWRPFDHWSAPLQNEQEEYIIDDVKRVLLPADEACTSLEAIQFARKELAKDKSVVRLVGLSGMGKTRMVEALFDERVGTDALDYNMVVYGDMSANPEVSAARMAEMLGSSLKNTILVVDNCPATTHKAIYEILHRATYPVSLLTVDFDVGKDQPHTTQVIRLKENSEDVISELLKLRYPRLSQADRDRLVEFSGGNARIALALAQTALERETLSDLNDNELIDRLFLNERRQSNERLMRCIEVASLVNAFYIEGDEDEQKEAMGLSALAGCSYEEFYRSIADGLELGIVQQRGRQRSVLPQGLASVFARRALKSTPPKNVYDQMVVAAPFRLFVSFTKRLGQFHDLKIATKIADQLIGEDGVIAGVTKLSDKGFEALTNLAPLVPEKVINLYEEALKSEHVSDLIGLDNYGRVQHVGLIHKIAYFGGHFERCANIILEFAKADDPSSNHNVTSSHFIELFSIAHSCTMAPPKQRFDYLKKLIASNKDDDLRLVLQALDRAAQTSFFSSSHHGDFGARSRTYGWYPQNQKDGNEWYIAAVNCLLKVVKGGGKYGQEAEKILGRHLRGLIDSGMIDLVTELVDSLGTKRFWGAGWRELCETLYFGRKGMSAELCLKVEALERKARPKTLDARFEAFVLEPSWHLYDPDKSYEPNSGGGRLDVKDELNTMAKELLVDRVKLGLFLSRAFDNDSIGSSTHDFGYELGCETDDLDHLWNNLIGLFKTSENSQLNCSILNGVLRACGEKDEAKAQTWLDTVIEDEDLQKYVCAMSTMLPINEQTLSRLTKAAGNEEIGVFDFVYIRLDDCSSDGISELLGVLCERGPDGISVATDMLAWQFSQNRKENVQTDAMLLEVGNKILLLDDEASKLHNSHDYNLSCIADVCLGQKGSEYIAEKLCDRFIAEISTSFIISRNKSNITTSVLKHHPAIFIDKMLGDGPHEILHVPSYLGMYDDDDKITEGLFNDYNSTVLLDWVRADPEARASRAARLIVYVNELDSGWSWSQVALELIKLGGANVNEVLGVFGMRFSTGGSSGGWGQRYIRRLPLTAELKAHKNVIVREWAEKENKCLLARIKEAEEMEKREEQRFE